MNALKWLEEWYIQNCDGDWEQCCGIKIGTLDNPGWYINIDLANTNYENKQFEKVVIQRTEENDWLHCNIVDNVFKGRGGPLNFEEIIEVFKSWCLGIEEKVI